MDDTSPTARALLVLEMVQNQPGIGAAQLAARLGLSDRAVRRNVAVLREAGIPVESTRGRYGGYRVGRGLRVPPLMFTATEALALVMAVLEGHDAADPEDPVGSALGKIVRVLPEPLAKPVDAIRRVTARGWDVGVPDVETTAALVQASAARRRVRLSYRLGPGREARHGRRPVGGRGPTPALVPARLVAHQGRQARAAGRPGELASRVLPETFTPPADLDPVATLEEHLSQGWRYAVEVEIEAPLADVEHWLPRSFGRLEAMGDRRTRLVATTDEPEWYAAQLAELPFDFRLVDSVEVRAAMDVLARRLRAAAGPEDAQATADN